MFGLQSYPGGRTHHGTTIRRRSRTIIIALCDKCGVIAATVQPAADDRVPGRLALRATGSLAIAMVANFMAPILRSNGGERAAQRLPGILGEEGSLVTDQGTTAWLDMLAGDFVWKVTERVEPENGNRRSDWPE
jgi:hypothetical protein